MHAIEIKNLKKSYKNEVAVKDMDFYVEKGDFFGFIGPNGAGKTTTIQCIMGLLKFDGKISIFGNDNVIDYIEARKLIGFSPQEENLDPFLNVEQALHFTAGYYGLKKDKIKERVELMLKDFGLVKHRKKNTRALSGGMKRRLLLARSLVHDPKILILDEPTAAMDVELRQDFWKLMKRINGEGKTIMLTSHYIEEVEQLCNTICIVNEGKIIAMDKKETIMQDLSNQELKIKTNKPVPSDLIKVEACKIIHENTHTLVVGKDIRKKANGIIKIIEKAGIKIEEIDIRNESLEKVFLRITQTNANQSEALKITPEILKDKK
ncbi:MAG: ABC transporter ATP-binding protein [Nanoarchaeota archaeon]|nr:ABC transporter ATP-binding protein [Nanoarchaeota archaeon]